MTTTKLHCVLFTNLDGLYLHGIHLHANALLLEEEWHDEPARGFQAHECRMRGFGPDSSWPVFQRAIPAIEWTHEARQSDGFLVSQSNRTAPLFQGGAIKLRAFPEPILYTLHDRERELDVRRFETSDDVGFAKTLEEVWKMINYNTQTEYWTEPGMPRIKHGFSPRAQARIAASRKPEPAKEEGVARHRNCGGLVKIRGEYFRCIDCGVVCTTDDTERAQW